ncbi:MAG: Rieske (2Fe-2S) domain protein [Streptosporangiaceae bacterium]|nr:Rieske (2Fe-2S) domain protein [Streptosporangiaceae bacterium]
MDHGVRKIFRRRSRPLPRAHPVDLAEGLQHARGLDPAVRSLSRAVRGVLPPGPIKDILHGVPAGQPAHPPLTDVPVGCWTSAAILDLMPGGHQASAILIAVGLAAAAPAALTGLADWSALHLEQQRVGLIHAAGTTTASCIYLLSLAARRRGYDGTGKALGYAGYTALLLGAYLGGHMAFRQGAGASHAEPVAHLVPLGWQDLCRADELPEGWPVYRRLGYISLFVLRTGYDIHVLGDRCAHLAGPLHQGRVVFERDAYGADQLCVVCPWHGSTFRVRDGAVVHGPATGRQPAFDTRLSEEGMVQVRPKI